MILAFSTSDASRLTLASGPASGDLMLHQAVDHGRLDKGVSAQAADAAREDQGNDVKDAELPSQCPNLFLDVHLRAPHPIRYFKASTVFDFSRRRR